QCMLAMAFFIGLAIGVMIRVVNGLLGVLGAMFINGDLDIEGHWSCNGVAETASVWGELVGFPFSSLIFS
nr:hypothetical protein [Vibrio vulnificus]